MNRVLLLSSCLVICSINLIGQIDSEQYKRAEVSYKLGNYTEAEILGLQVFGSDTLNLDFQLFIAKNAAGKFQYVRSMKRLDNAKALLTGQSSSFQKFVYHYCRGFNYEVNKAYDESYKSYSEAYEYLLELEDPFYGNLLFMRTIALRSEKDFRDKSVSWIEEYGNYIEKLEDRIYKMEYHYTLANHYFHKDSGIKALEHANKYIDMTVELKNPGRTSHAYMVKGLVFAENQIVQNQDSAYYYYVKSLDTNPNKNNKLFINTGYFNIGASKLKAGDTTDAINLFYKAWGDTTKSRDSHRRKMISEKLYPIYERRNQCDSALYFHKQFVYHKEENNTNTRSKKLDSLQMESYISEKESELEIEAEKRKKSQIIAIGLGSSLGMATLIGFLLFKNTKRKQRIAEQERELEIQKKEKILKDQELTTIDAMIEGQEKERQRLASDLHDSVGATLSAAKLQFDHIAKNRNKQQELDELFDKTGQLLEEAYTEVRSMAHVKNSGVIAKQGLLPAVQKLARNASGTNGLQIEVEDFGLTERLENTLEISVFRIIQELVTNIIKHAEASEATISITQHEDSLNIIVEDNGKGFKALQLPKKEGMGLFSIEKRVEHLEGSMEVDSTPRKGTSVLIDIPL